MYYKKIKMLLKWDFFTCLGSKSKKRVNFIGKLIENKIYYLFNFSNRQLIFPTLLRPTSNIFMSSTFSLWSIFSCSTLTSSTYSMLWIPTLYLSDLDFLFSFQLLIFLVFLSLIVIDISLFVLQYCFFLKFPKGSLRFNCLIKLLSPTQSASQLTNF